jgi:RNA polymerase sigma-70 factor, ECF subfamily
MSWSRATGVRDGYAKASTDSVSRVPVSPDPPVLPGVATGDVDAVAELWERYADRIRSLGLNLSAFDPCFADDLVQETFARLWRSASRYDSSLGSEPTFVFTVARRAAVDLWRRGRRASHDQSLDLTDSSASSGRGLPVGIQSEDGHDAVLTSWVVNEALAALGPAQRQVIDLAYFGQLSQSEIAARLGIPLGTVKTRTFAALKILRAALAEQGLLP